MGSMKTSGLKMKSNNCTCGVRKKVRPAYPLLGANGVCCYENNTRQICWWCSCIMANE